MQWPECKKEDTVAMIIEKKVGMTVAQMLIDKPFLASLLKTLPTDISRTTGT